MAEGGCEHGGDYRDILIVQIFVSILQSSHLSNQKTFLRVRAVSFIEQLNYHFLGIYRSTAVARLVCILLNKKTTQNRQAHKIENP